MKTNENKKLTLNKSTVATLTGDEQKKVLAGAADTEYPKCWENLWTLYHCDMVWTGDKEPEKETQRVARLGNGA